MTGTRLLLAACIVFAATERSLAAQDTVVVRGACNQCGVSRSRVATLRMPSTEPAFVLPNAFATASDGSIFLADGFGSRTVHRFNPDGRYGGPIGRTGSGPGEYGLVRALAMDGGALRVFSTRQAVFSSQGALVDDKTIGTGMQVRAAVVADGALIINGSHPAPERVGKWLHRVRPDGSISHSFDLMPAGSSRASSFDGSRALARSPDGVSVWAARYNRYEITRWSLEGKALRSVRREVDWFEPWAQWDGRVSLNPSVPRLLSVLVDSAGLVWTLVRVPDRAWKSDPQNNRMPTPSTWDGIDDTIVEVLDVERGVVVAHQRWPEALDRFDALGRVIQLAELDDGEVVVNVWRLAVSRR